MAEGIETELMTVPEAAAFLKISVSTMRRLVAARSVTTIQIGRARRVTLKALRQYIANLERQVRTNQ